MTRALLTKKFVDALAIGGFMILPDAGGLTATVYRDKRDAAGKFIPADAIGKLTYSEQSVDYDELMRLVRSAA